mgnify:CR=1 FL=1
MKKVFFLTMAFLVLSLDLAFAQWSGIIKEDDKLVILDIYNNSDSKVQNCISVNENGRIISKVKNDTIVASQNILWNDFDGAVQFRNVRTKAPVTYCSKEAKKIEKTRSLLDYVFSLFNSKVRGVKGDNGMVDKMMSLLSATWYMCFGEVCIPSELPQSADENKLYYARLLDGRAAISLDYDDRTNEIVITKEKLRSLGIGELKNGDNIKLVIDYSDGKKKDCLSTCFTIVYEN